MGTRDKRGPDPRIGVRRVDSQPSWLGSANSDPNIAILATPEHLAHHDVERHCVLRPINPAGAVWHVYAAIDRGDVAGLAARLTPNFRFTSDDPHPPCFPDWLDRHGMAVFLDQMVQRTEPGPEGIQVSFGELTLDPPTTDFHAAPGRYKVVVQDATIDLTLADGKVLHAGPRTHTFEVECTALLPGISKASYPKGIAVCAVCRWDEVVGRSRSMELPVARVPNDPPDSLAGRVPNHPPDSLAVPAVLALRVLSNGRRGSIALEIALPIAGDARLEMFDVAGRRVESRELSGLTRGIHPVGIPAQLANGVYWARLQQGTSMRTARVVILR